MPIGNLADREKRHMRACHFSFSVLAGLARPLFGVEDIGGEGGSH